MERLLIEHTPITRVLAEAGMAGYLKPGIQDSMLTVAGLVAKPGDFYGPTQIYSRWRNSIAAGGNFLVSGPWNHGGWSRQDGSSLGNISSKATQLTNGNQDRGTLVLILAKDKGQLIHGSDHVPHRTNAWQQLRSMASGQHKLCKAALHARRRKALVRSSDETGDAFDSYISDPANPCRTCRPVEQLFPFWAQAGARGSWRTSASRTSARYVVSWKTNPSPRI